MTGNEYSIIRMRNSGILIGERCRIYTFLQSNEPSMIQIGNDVKDKAIDFGAIPLVSATDIFWSTPRIL